MTNIEYFYDVTYGSLFLPRPVFMFSFANQSRPPRFKKNIYKNLDKFNLFNLAFEFPETILKIKLKKRL